VTIAAVTLDSVDVILRDGRTLRLRRARREGAESPLELFPLPNIAGEKGRGAPERARARPTRVEGPPARLNF
jgi:hypothetical protein